MSRRDERDPAVMKVADVLHHLTARAMYAGKRNLAEQRVKALDGPDRGESTGRSSNPTSTTERNATEAARLALMAEDGDDLVYGLQIAAKACLDWADKAVRTRAFAATVERETDPHEEMPICQDGQLLRDGAAEWGGPCEMPQTKSRLCQAHYHAMWKWRKARGLPNESEAA